MFPPQFQTGRKRNPGARTCTGFFPVLLLFFWAIFPADPAGAWDLDTSQDRWGILAGYGQSFPDWGRTTQRVETIDLVPRYNHRLVEDFGSGWYRGFHSITVEVPFHLVVSPDTSSMIGVNFLACYTFTAVADQMRPYLFGGGGPVYNFADIPGMGADLNGNYQFGIGLEHDWTRGHDLLVEFRYHHISNAGSKDPNEPLNSCKLLVGFTF